MRRRKPRWSTGATSPSRRELVDEHRPGVRRVGQHPERGRVGHEPQLADRAHALDRLEVVEAVHRLHRHRQPDARAHAPLEAVARGGLRPHRAVVAAPQEPDEPQPGLLGPRHDVRRVLGARHHIAGVGVGDGAVGSGSSSRWVNWLMA